MTHTAPLLPRLIRYQAERFPLAAYAPLVAIASLAAIGWSRAARGAAGYVPTSHGLTAALTMLTAFALLRVADEHKDAALDRVARPELPVPRGLVTLGELRFTASLLVTAVVALNAYVMPVALVPLGAVALWTALMTREFFVPDWLRARPALYLVSHMVILPLILLYGSTADWLAVGAAPPRGLIVFLAASYACGLVLELGRKLRDPLAERPGVETYTGAWGSRRALQVWGSALLAAALLIGLSMRLAGSSLALAAAVPAVAALITASAAPALAAGQPGSGKRIESRSALFTLLAYAALALPWVLRQMSR